MAKMKMEPLTMQMDDTTDTGTGDTRRNIEDLMEEYLTWIYIEKCGKDVAVPEGVQDVAHYVEMRKRQNCHTYGDYRRHLVKVWPLHEGEDEVEKIYAYVNEPGIAPNTKNSRISNIKPFWNWMVQNGYRSEPWPRKIKKVKYVPRPAAPPTELVHKALTYFAMRAKRRQKWAQWRDYAIILTLAVSGARPKEVLSVMPEWVDLNRKLIYLPAKRTKTAVRREIPITGAEDVLRSLMDFHTKHVDAGVFLTDSPLFCGPAGRPYSRFGFAGMWNRVRNEAGGWQYQAGDGLRDLNPYDLRHHFATTCIRADMDLITLADILGHATLETTRKYTHLSPEDIAKRGGFIGDYIARFGSAEKKKRVRKPNLTM